MKRSKYFILILFTLSCHHKAVSPVDYKSLNSLTPNYKFNSVINYYFQQTQDGGVASTDYSYVSEHQKLISSLISSDSINPISSELSLEIKKKYQIKNALEYILSASQNHEIVMLNEDHAIPQHRNFLGQLLPGLAKIGYTNLGLEGLNNVSRFEKEISKDGYPSTYHGNYIKEPEFGNLIRKAKRLGFNVFGYSGEGEDGSARNILAKIDSFSEKGKTIILCGWDHIKEGPTETYWEYAIAGRIKEFSGLDPLTINQTQYFEKAEKIYEDSLYQTLDLVEPAVLVDAKNESIDLETNPEWYDLFVFHPRTEFESGIPNWILKEKQIKKFQIPEIEINCPCKVFLFEEREDVIKAVPSYIIEIPKLQNEVLLPVSKDVKYKLMIGSHENTFIIE